MAERSEGSDFAAVQGIPHELVDWHAAAASTGVDVTFQDFPVALADRKRSDDGVIVFWVENQNGYYWAIDANQTEHDVFYRENASSVWRHTGEKLDRFLLHCTVHEAIVRAENKFSAVVPTSSLQGALARFSPLPFRPLAHEDPATELLCSSDALARVAPPPVGYSHPGKPSWLLTIAAPRESSVQKYRRALERSILPSRPVDACVEDLPF